MLSKSQLKLIRSLKVKKYRYKERMFLVESPKLVNELLKTNHPIQQIFALSSWIHDQQAQLDKHAHSVQEISAKELAQISNLKTPNQVVAMVPIVVPSIEPSILTSNVNLVLADIRDPGNLGTIIRIADWFNIPYIFCSLNSVDMYNPKVVQSTMGAIFHTKVFYTDLMELFHQYPNLPVYGTSMVGQSIFETHIPAGSFVIIGNEAQGIGSEILAHCHHMVSIPKYGKAESLNASVAAGIICAIIKHKA